MPLSTVCVSTVNKRPRTWSSYTNIRARDEEDLTDMNATEEITVFKEPKNNYQSPRLGRRTLGYGYDFPEKSPKKDKKWSISSIFRRKKKEESESSSEEDSSKKCFLNRSRKKKSDGKRKKHVKTLGTFDHVVVPPCPRNSLLFNGSSFHDDSAVLSDPTGGFSNYVGRPRPVCMKGPFIDFGVGSGSVDNVNNKKSKKVLVKARAEARRTSSKNENSSDEESQRSNSSLHVRSEENLKPRETPTNRKSRAARTERYMKRHSRDGENPHNYLRLSKSDVENTTSNWKLSDDSNRSPSRSPLVPRSIANGKAKLSFTSLSSQSTNISGLSTVPPSHANTNRFRVSNSTSNPSYKQSAQSINDYNHSTKKIIDIGNFFPDQRSVSCDANIHKAPSTDLTEAVLNVQLPILRPNTRGYRNLSLIDPAHLKRIRQPPPPPPRDPNRMIGMHFFEGGRPNSYYFDSSGQSRTKPFNTSTPHHIMPQRKFNSFNLNPNLRSTSEDCLPRDHPNVQLATRPSSTTPESGKPQRYISRRAGTVATGEELNYLADKNPRSRKPIFVQYGNKSLDSNTSAKTEVTGGQKALDFWKQIDQKNMNTEKPSLNTNRSNSPQIFTSHTRIQTQVFLPSVLQTDINNSNTAIEDDNRISSPFKPISPISPTQLEPPPDDVMPSKITDDTKRKSSNLEEALDELEAIYNSLRLGDEDLLERAEQRERESQAKKCQLNLNAFPNYSARGALSDSSFSYEPFDSVDSPRRKRLMKKNRTVDVKHDDMAFRKLNKERASTISDPQSVISKVSYLLASPIHATNGDEEKSKNNSNEPDITYDDVVYRNIKRSKNSLKVVEPQPPFGIPLGPITPAANSDYLHAKPDNIYRPLFKHKKIPDIVKDDLAFRNLRKDGNKRPALPPLSADDYKNNNSDSLSYLKKKRAQRSLSANIGNLLQNENIIKNKISDEEGENEYNTLTHIADAMEIARKVLKEKENRISATRKAFMSDTDTQYFDSKEPISGIEEERRNFLNGLKSRTLEPERHKKASSPRLCDNVLLCKPPRGRSPKESTPVPLSPLDDKKSAKSESTSSSMDDLLNALAEEAKETTERITNELKLLAEENEKRASLKREEPKTKDEHITPENINNNLLDCVVDSTELIKSSRDPDEVVEHIKDNETVTEAANVVLNRVDSKDEHDNETKSDHDYENLVSDNELNVDKVVVEAMDEQQTPVTCRSPFEEHKQELIASFQELKENMQSIELPRKRRASQHKEVESIYDNIEELKDTTDNNKGVAGEKERGRVFDIVALPSNECALTINANPLNSEQTFTSNCDIVLKKPINFLLHDDSETSSGFHSNCSCGGDSSHQHKFEDFGSSNNLDSLESLKSPKLVMETTNNVSVRDGIDGDVPRSSRLVLEASQDLSKTNATRNVSDDRGSCLSRRVSENNGDVEKGGASWYRDPATVAFACSYGIACAHQLAQLDLFAILSILFAVISFIATLFL